MKPLFLFISAALLVAGPVSAQTVEKVRPGTKDAPGLPEDLFELPPNSWAFAKQLWAGREPCTKDQCEAGYNAGEAVVSVERSNEDVRVVGGFRGCQSVAWNMLNIGSSASKSDSKEIGRRIKKVLSTSAKYCKMTAPTIPPLDAAQLFPPKQDAAPNAQ